MKVTFWGTRGSVPTPGPDTVKYGGNTACVEVRLDDGPLIILDAGTGIRELGLSLASESGSLHAHVLISHPHWDHIQGWPFFQPAYEAGNHFTVIGCHLPEGTVQQALEGQMADFYFPVDCGLMRDQVGCRERNDDVFDLDGVRIRTIRVNHPGLATGFRIEQGEKSLVYLTDNELSRHGPELTPYHDFVSFCEGADLLIHDTQYTEKEIADKRGWGHSSDEEAMSLALEAGARRLALFHYDPLHDDATIDGIVAAREKALREQDSDLVCIGSREKMTVDL
jgi:phosphoribosyl 1,2-cyclic phosphodiesterase